MADKTWFDMVMEELYGDFEKIEEELFRNDRQEGIEMSRMRNRDDDELDDLLDDDEEEIDLFDEEDEDTMDIEVDDEGGIELTPDQEAEEIRRGNLPDSRDNVLEPERDPLPEGAGTTEPVDYNISADIRDWANVMRGEDEEIPLFEEEEGIEMTEMGGGEAGEVVEFGGEELPGLFTDIDLGEAAESATLGGEIAGEAAVEGAAAAGFAEAVGAVAAVAGPVAAAVGAAVAIGTLVDAVVKSNERVDNAKAYIKKLSAIADKTEGHTDTALEFYNNSVKRQNDYTRLYYKYVFGKDDPLNFEKNVGTGKNLLTFTYKSDAENLSKTQLTARIANMLNMDASTLENIFFNTKDLWGGDAIDIKKKKVLSIYNTLAKTRQFQDFVSSNTRSYRFETSFHQNITETLFSSDSRIQRHYEDQAKQDSTYKSDLTLRTQQINKYVKSQGFNVVYTEEDVAEGYNPKGARKFDLVNGYTKLPEILKVPFWVTYYKANEKRFKNDDLAVIERNDRRWQENGKRRLSKKVKNVGLEEQQYIDAYTEPHLHNKGPRGFIDYDSIVRKRRRRRPVRPDTPQPAPSDKPDKPKPTPSDKPGTDIPTSNKDLPAGDIPLMGDNAGRFQVRPDKENLFDAQMTYRFDLGMARHLAEVSDKSYEDNVEPFSIYDIVETIQIDIRSIGLLLHSRRHNTTVVCYRGTDIPSLSPMSMIDSGLDVLTDLAIDSVPYLNMKVHSGFFDYYNRSFEQVSNFIKKYSDNKTKLLSCGHSLGASPAVYLAYCWGYKHEKFMGCYNYGSPRGVTDKGDFDQFAPYVYRIADYNDPIAAVPLQVMGFHHVGDCYMINSTDTMATLTHLGNTKKADDAYKAGLTSLLFATYHKMSHYRQSLRFIAQHYTSVGASARSEKKMIDTGGARYDIGLEMNPKASKKVLITSKAKYKHTGEYFKDKAIYQQIDGARGSFITNYHADYGMMMTPIPRSLKDAIVGVYFYKPGEFKSSGAVKGFVAY